ncbi:MAG: 4-(cytidine 5'-diphospho)-2-C-methyl-D-erythritol kinase [Nitrospinota bacterium]
MDQVRLSSHAKINLFLKILSKNSDGYHNICSLMSKIEFADLICVKKSRSSKIVLKSPLNQAMESDNNLIIKAVTLYDKNFGLDFGLEIELLKYLPIAAGLGGGSSNAATTLIALTMLDSKNVSIEDLKPVAIELGSDVPFFLQYKGAIVEATGGEVTKFNLPKKFDILLAKPKFSISTKDSYQNSTFDFLTPFDKQKTISTFLTGDLNRISQVMVNDLEQYALDNYQELVDLKLSIESLPTPPLKTLLAGSGSTLLAFFNNPGEIKIAIKQLKSENLLLRQSATL